MKLYEVTARYYVLAENELDAEYTNIVNSDGADMEIEEIESVDDIDPNWRDAIPFCTNPPDDLTCRQIMEEVEV